MFCELVSAEDMAMQAALLTGASVRQALFLARDRFCEARHLSWDKLDRLIEDGIRLQWSPLSKQANVA
jgi:hypothetical protein